LASFGWCKFRLSKQSVGFLLQATIGGTAVDFRPQQISERVFKFVVNSRNMGFQVCGELKKPVINTKFISIFGVMVVLIGPQRFKSIIRKRKINGYQFIAIALRNFPMLMR
jgi:hypothetical protein